MQNTQLMVQVEGSTGTLYEVVLIRHENGLSATCTCPAGEKRIHCKHRLNLFAGDVSHVRGDTLPSLTSAIASILRGTDVEDALRAMIAAEAEAKALADKLKKLKKNLDRVMYK